MRQIFLRWIVAYGYSSNCTLGTIRVVPMGYTSSCAQMGTIRIVPWVQFELYPWGVGVRRAQGARRDALASHAVSVYTRFSQAPSISILAVGAEALSMTPSGDALFAS